MITPQAPGGFLLGFLIRHSIFDQRKVAYTLLSRSVAQLNTAAGRRIGQMWGRNVNIALDGMVITKMRINVGGCNLASSDRADDRSRTGYCVAARENMRRIRNKGIRFSLYFATYDGGNLLERLSIDRLSDGNDHNITRNTE